jgi:hypothetical protein
MERRASASCSVSFGQHRAPDQCAGVRFFRNNGAQPAVADPDAAGNTWPVDRVAPTKPPGLGTAGTELDCSRGPCPHPAEGDIRALNEGAGFDPMRTSGCLFSSNDAVALKPVSYEQGFV